MNAPAGARAVCIEKQGIRHLDVDRDAGERQRTPGQELGEEDDQR